MTDKQEIIATAQRHMLETEVRFLKLKKITTELVRHLDPDWLDPEECKLIHKAPGVWLRRYIDKNCNGIKP